MRTSIFGLISLLVLMSGCGPSLYVMDAMDAPDLRTGAGQQPDPDLNEFQLFGTPTKVVALADGQLAGRRDNDVWAFKGVPYAQPPVGPLRWQPPAPVLPWSGIKKADAFGAVCTQPDGESVVGSEDCLTLNVWTSNLAPKKAMPVMIFIHGGSFTMGSSTSFGGLQLYIGDELAKTGTVIVTLNYRLGVMGFLAHPGFETFNHGTLDQIEAINWVRRNAHAFGGDADQVTIFGESAGAMSVCALLASPLTQGLFHRAIIESGGCEFRPLATDARGARTDAAAVGCARGDLNEEVACLQTVPAATLIAAQRKVPINEQFAQLAYQPSIDGVVLPAAPLATIATGSHHQVPVIVGANKKEVPGIVYFKQNDKASYTKLLRSVYPSDEAFKAVSGYYSKSRFGSYMNAMGALHTDRMFVCSTRRLARLLNNNQAEAVFTYNYDALGAFHGTELPMIFQRLGFLGGDLQLAMGRYWTNFAKNGVPTAKGQPAWPKYDEATDRLQILASPIKTVSGYTKAGCDVIDRFQPH